MTSRCPPYILLHNASSALSPTSLPHASPFSSFLPPHHSHLLFPSPPFHTSTSSSCCPSPCCTRLRGVITPPTAQGPTWTPLGGTMRASCLPTGMYPCLSSDQPQTTPVFWVFTNQLFNLFSFLFSSSSFSLPLLPCFCCIFFFLSFSFFFCLGGGVSSLYFFLLPGFVYSACSVFGVVMRLMRTRFPLLPGSLT